ncbi:MAG: hypothetical protein HC942_23310 [Microcoleus sp. SU_5_6]|nr:hypothetical protein [Microcoleus sp. SU_5_6]
MSDGVLDDRLKHAESHVKPLLVEAMSVKRQPNRSLKVLMAINYGSIIWVEKTSGVEVLAPKI